MVSATGSAMTAVQRPVGPNGNAGSKRAILVNQRAPIVRASNQVGLAAAPKIVVGADDRRIVSNTTSRWARQTVLIYEATTGGWCTGFMVSPDTVATAGHCVYHNSPGKPVGWWDYRNTTVYPGYNGSTGVAPYGSCSVKDMYTNTSWQATQNNWNYDYAAIKLNCTVGNTVGWYGMTTNGYTTATTLYTQGYPQDKTPKYSMWSTSGTVAQFLSFGQLVTYMDIIGGQSGSPVYRYDSGCQYCAVAIVSWSGASYNGLNRLNTNSVNMIKGVINS